MKRLITCSDGTWNSPGIKDRGQLVKSNVELIYNCIARRSDKDNVEQLKVYDAGVGSSTYNWKDKIRGGTTGAGIDKNIKDVYSFLVLNYAIGDEIYLFGFSRGAYTARSLAGFIRNCGILKPEYLHLIDQAYELYRDRNSYSNPDSDLMVGFKKNYCFENVTRIKFLGVWDTVGSLGVPLPWYKFYNKERYKFHDVTISSTVDNAFHALAIDERRKLFSPTLWELSNTVKKDATYPQVMEQRWFPGVHCNVGGGYVDHGLSDITLDWLMTKANEVGLYFDKDCLGRLDPAHVFKADPNGELRNSRTAMYWFWRPFLRPIKEKKYSNEVIDYSVIDRRKKDPRYSPGNLAKFFKTQKD